MHDPAQRMRELAHTILDNVSGGAETISQDQGLIPEETIWRFLRACDPRAFNAFIHAAAEQGELTPINSESPVERGRWVLQALALEEIYF